VFWVWGLGVGHPPHTPQAPIPNPQSPIPNLFENNDNNKKKNLKLFIKI